MSMDSGQDALAACLEEALLRRKLENKQLKKVIESLLHQSVEYGRASRVLGTTPSPAACQQYVQDVITYYQQHHVFVNCLERRDRDAWIITINKIRMWANSYLRNRHIDGPLRIEIVEESVPNAALAFLSSVYHYDTDFDAWFAVLVQNVCKKYIKNQMHSNRELENEAQSVDRVELMLERLADGSGLNAQSISELRSDLLEAIKKLSSEARKALIMHYYFSGYSFKEISKKMDRSMTAVYKLHHDAIKELRGIMDDDWY